MSSYGEEVFDLEETKSQFRWRCHICLRFKAKNKPCKNEHNMEKYWDRMDAQADYDMMLRDEQAMEEAGGLDAVQEKQRRDYYVGKYGEY